MSHASLSLNAYHSLATPMVDDLDRLLCFHEIRSFLPKVRSPHGTLVITHYRTYSCGIVSKRLRSDTLLLQLLYYLSYGEGDARRCIRWRPPCGYHRYSQSHFKRKRHEPISILICSARARLAHHARLSTTCVPRKKPNRHKLFALAYVGILRCVR